MSHSVRTCLLYSSLLLMLLSPGSMKAQDVFPSNVGEQMRYTAYIEMPKAYLSGVCILLHEGDVVKGCLFNEFGLTALDFTYCLQKQKVKLHSVVPQLDKWYIRRMLKKDLLQLMQRLQQGDTQYRNERHQITYQLTPIHETTE